MRIRFNILLTILSYSCASIAGVPLQLTVETSRAVHTKFDAYQGETLSFEATLQSYGKPLEAPAQYAFYWQTNGMGNAYWSAPCTVPDASRVAGAGTNVLFATFTPDMDVGAKSYNCFIGLAGSIYHAAFQLNLRPSPGALPNELPLPQKVIDFSQVTVLNPPWPSAGTARPLPKYLHYLTFDDSYPDDAAWYYAQPQDFGGCSAVRDGGFLYRNYDFPFDDRAEFVVTMSAGPGRFASVGVANVGTNLTEDLATSGKWSRYYKCLPGHTVDGINEHGVAVEVNVVATNGMERWRGDPATGVHCLGAVRWVLDHATNAAHAAQYLADHVYVPSGWTQNFHYMIADERNTYFVENGDIDYDAVPIHRVFTNFTVLDDLFIGEGRERYEILQMPGESITNVWYTRAYSRLTDPAWMSDFGDNTALYNAALDLWNDGRTKEQHRGETHDGQHWWQTVHTSIYDLKHRVLRIAVQETDDWYVFTCPPADQSVTIQNKRDLTDLAVYTNGYTRWTWTYVSSDGDKPANWLEIANSQADNQPYYSGGYWFCPPIGGCDCEGFNPEGEDAVELEFSFYNGGSTVDPFSAIATRTVIPLHSQVNLAKTTDLDGKRDLTDRTFVTYEPGDWTPSVVDGVWYSPQYYGEGWSVEKYLWYDEWGEWYWEDSEWIYDDEDATVLVAHKLWSGEEITLTRTQVPVEDNLALESQIGSVAASAAREYLNGNDLVKWKKVLRTGLPGQWGTGWGNVHWEFASDRRWWTMKVPDFTATVTAGGHVDSNGNDVVSSSITIGGRSYVTDPMRRITRTPVKILTQTDGTNGTERCATATWNSVLVPTGEQSAIDDPDACAYAIRFSLDFQDGLSVISVLPRRLLAPIVYNDGAYYETSYTMSDFSAEIKSVTNSSATVKCRYACRAKYRPSSSSYTPVTYTNWFTVALSAPSGAYTETTKEYGRVVTSDTRNLFWDPALHATWKIDVTNGCFFSEIVSTNNLTGVK